MSTFTEADHPRDSSGQFAEKTHSEAQVGIESPETIFMSSLGSVKRVRESMVREADQLRDQIRDHIVATFPDVKRLTFFWDDDVDARCWALGDDDEDSGVGHLDMDTVSAIANLMFIRGAEESLTSLEPDHGDGFELSGETMSWTIQ